MNNTVSQSAFSRTRRVYRAFLTALLEMKTDLTLELDHVDEFVRQRCVPGALGLELAGRAAAHLHVNSSLSTAKALLNQTMGPFLMVGLTAAVVADLLPPEPQASGIDDIFSPQVVAEFARDLDESWLEAPPTPAQVPPIPTPSRFPAISYQTPPPSIRPDLPAPSAPSKRGRKKLNLTPARRTGNIKVVSSAAAPAAGTAAPAVAAAPVAAAVAGTAAGATAPPAPEDALLKNQPLVASQEELAFVLESTVADDGAVNMSQVL